MAEDMSNIVNNVKKMIDSGNIPNNISEILEKMNSSSNNISSPSIYEKANTSNNSNKKTNNNFNIDIETIMKMKNIIDSINTNDDPRANLLYSLKPYLRESRKNKLDQYINILNMTKIAEFMNSDKKEKNSNV